MKDFDEAREERAKTDRTFTVAGEQFTRRPAVAPETILHWNQATSGEIDLTEQEWLDVYDETILAMLEPGQEEKWASVRDAGIENPLTVADLTAIIRWLFEEMAGRPTGPSSDSSDGRESSATTSKDDSSSKPAGVPGS